MRPQSPAASSSPSPPRLSSSSLSTIMLPGAALGDLHTCATGSLRGCLGLGLRLRLGPARDWSEGGRAGTGAAPAARLYHRPSGSGAGPRGGLRAGLRAPCPAIGGDRASRRPLLRMRSVSSKMSRMRQCALRPRSARPAPPRPTGCCLALHLETPIESGLPPPGPRPPAPSARPRTSRARPALGALPLGPAPPDGACGRASGCWGRRGGGREPVGQVPGVSDVPDGRCAPAPLCRSCSPAPFKASLERFLKTHLLLRLEATFVLLNLVNVCRDSFPQGPT